MGGNSSSREKSQVNEEEYLRMLKRRRQRAADIAHKESHQRGKAYQELKNQQEKRQIAN